MLRKPPGPKGSNQRAAAVSITIQREHRRTERTLRYVGDWTAGRGRVLGWVGTAGGLHKRLLISSSQFSPLRGVFRYGPPTRLTLTRGPRLCWLALVVALAVHHASAVAVADPPSDPSGAWVTDRYATTVAASGRGTVYLGGSFKYMGPPTGGGVNALAVSGSTVYVGGSFTSVKGQSRKYLVAVDQTGAPTAWNPILKGSVNALVLSGRTLYAGGSFTSSGQTVRNRLAAFDTQGVGLESSWNPNASGTVNALALSGSTVYVGGRFTQMGGVARNRLAAVSASAGALQSWNPTVTDITDNPNVLAEEVHALELSGGTVYIGGTFYWLAGPQTLNDYVTQGEPRLNVGAVDAATGERTAWDLNASGRVSALAVSGGKLFVGGGFDSVGGLERRYLAEVDLATGVG